MAQAPMKVGQEADPLAQAVRRALAYLVAQQGQDGAWHGDYGGPMFLLPMYVAARYIARQPIPAEQRVKMIAYLRHQLNSDGSIGLHVEAPGSMFTTSLAYVALRFLGVSADDPDLGRMRHWIADHGTPLGSASWGKFILALLNLYDYDGLHPILPELWSLPAALPFHPSRLWCHCRQVYLPLAYLYGLRAHIPADTLIKELRGELYLQPYDQIRFFEHRDTVAPSDNAVVSSPLLRGVNRALGFFERFHSSRWRRRSMALVLDHIHYEDEATHYIRIGPVNAVLNTLVHHFCRPRSEATQRSFAALEQYLWDGHDGMKMNGYNSSALWDTAFAIQAILATPLVTERQDCLQRAHHYLRTNQVLEDVPQRERYFRHASRGGWPFSDRAHGWPITDCTAEGLTCALALEQLAEPPVAEQLMKDSVQLILSWQNRDGGWATYEKQRGGRWLELLNPSQVFSNIMVDYSYVECTAACIKALGRAKRRFAGCFDQTIDLAIQRGEHFIRQRQRADGSWEGSWGVCFTYGTWFAVNGLIDSGASTQDPAIQQACRFLLTRQQQDGGWGEHYRSCSERQYVPHAESQVVNTAWALLTLIRAGQGASEPAHRAACFLIERQQPDGDWPRQSLSGVFNKSTLINYEFYRRTFPLWALAEYARAG